jgi:hypothetical protein
MWWNPVGYGGFQDLWKRKREEEDDQDEAEAEERPWRPADLLSASLMW